MFEIVKKQMLTPIICLMEIDAYRVAQSCFPGQFLIVRTYEQGERIPLTICDYDREKGTITIVVQIVGASTKIMCERFNEGDCFADIVGPLGIPSEFVEMPIEELKKQRFLFVAGGLGTAPVYPQVKYLHNIGVKVDVIIGARNKDLIIMEEEMAAVCDNLYICTDDGSKGEKGNVTIVMKRLFDSGKSYTQSVAIGPMIMMKFAALTCKEYKLPVTVSLNSLMVDGTGMCGACRVSVGGKTFFACVDGPEFNGYDVDFDEAMRRQAMYRQQELEAAKKI